MAETVMSFLLEQSEQELALSRSVLYSTLALVLSPPRPEILRQLQDPSSIHVFKEAAAEYAELSFQMAKKNAGAAAGGEPIPAAHPLLDAAAELGDRIRSMAWNEFDGGYQHLFGHTVAGRVSPYETEHGSSGAIQQAQELADVSGFYRAFGLHLPATRRQRVDHVAVECEFVAFLARREAELRLASQVEAAQQTCLAAQAFLRDHLGRFGPSFAAALSREAECSVHRSIGALLLELLSTDSRIFGIPQGPAVSTGRAAEISREPMACSNCSLLEAFGPD